MKRTPALPYTFHVELFSIILMTNLCDRLLSQINVKGSTAIIRR